MAPEMVAEEKAKVEATGRMPSIEMEPKTLTLDQLKFARVCIYICIESYIYPRSVYIRRISTASYMIPLDFECSSLSLFLFFSFLFNPNSHTERASSHHLAGPCNFKANLHFRSMN